MSYEDTAQYYDSFDTKGNLPFYMDLAARTGGNVLELGVGTGRVLLEIANLGREVVGVDNSVAMLREAKRKRRELYHGVSGRCRLLLADMLSLDLAETFGLVYAASGGVQSGSVDDLRGIFHSAARHLDGSGVFAFDVASPSSLRQTKAFPPERRELPGGRVVIRFVAQTYDEATDTVSYDLIFKEHIPGRTSTVTVTAGDEGAVVTMEAIEDALDYARLEAREIYGDFERSPYDDASKHIVVVAGLLNAP
ncbi:MAG: class I SAM-dependent methyltransferase [Candidatus Eisenbacteria bacterium]